MNPIRRRPCADPVQKHVPGEWITQKGIDSSRPVTEARMERSEIRGRRRVLFPGFRGACHRAALRADPLALSELARVRGFALEIADFEIFYLAKYLICNERRLRFPSKTAVVKTYPIPKPDVMRVDSSHHVSAPHRAKEERQVAPLLERGGEQAPR